MIQEGATVRIEGKVSQKKSKTEKAGELYFSNPKIEITQKIPLAVGKNLFDVFTNLTGLSKS